MSYKKEFLICGSVFLMLGIHTSCRQQVNKSANENKAVQIPPLFKDSAFLSIDRSPMDMVYFPAEYPKEKMISSGTEDPVARIIYSRPQKNGRMIFADSTVTGNFIQHYGKDWRLGANEATEIEFFRNVTINGKSLSRGRYIMYCIPYPGKWKIIFNSNLFSWGLHMDKTKDIMETEVPVTNNNTEIEYFTLLFENAVAGCNLVMLWGNVKAVLPISFR